MDDDKYCVEVAKSGRAACKRCKEPILKDLLRIGTKVKFGEHDSWKWDHVKCFKIPKKTNIDEFLGNLKGFQELNSAQQVQIHEDLSEISGTKRSAPVDAETPDVKSKKSSHKQSSPSKAKSSSSSAVDLTGEDEDEVYTLYKKMSLDELKDHLRWNRQLLKGTKSDLVKRCVDGHKNGAVPSCPEMGCGGKLTADFDLGIVTCSGKFQEDVGQHVRCYFKAKLQDIHRLPWLTAPPTEAEKAAMRAAASGDQSVSVEGVENLFDGINMADAQGKKQAASLLVAEARKRGIKIPVNDQEANIRVGGVLLMSGDGSAPGNILQQLATSFGTHANSQAKKAESAMGTANPANEGIIMALSELSQKYFAEGNVQAGGVYRKAIAAIRALPYKVESGKALTRPKTKVPGIGKKIGDLVDRFLATGSMASSAETENSQNEDEDDDF